MREMRTFPERLANFSTAMTLSGKLIRCMRGLRLYTVEDKEAFVKQEEEKSIQVGLIYCKEILNTLDKIQNKDSGGIHTSTGNLLVSLEDEQRKTVQNNMVFVCDILKKIDENATVDKEEVSSSVEKLKKNINIVEKIMPNLTTKSYY